MRFGHASVRSWLIVGRRNRGPRRSHSPRPRRDVAPVGDRLDVVQELHAEARQASRAPRRTHSHSPESCVDDRHRGHERAWSLPRHTFLHGRSTLPPRGRAFHYRAIEDRADVGVTLRSSFPAGPRRSMWMTETHPGRLVGGGRRGISGRRLVSFSVSARATGAVASRRRRAVPPWHPRSRRYGRCAGFRCRMRLRVRAPAPRPLTASLRRRPAAR